VVKDLMVMGVTAKGPDKGFPKDVEVRFSARGRIFPKIPGATTSYSGAVCFGP
jgi:hypothetical protein